MGVNHGGPVSSGTLVTISGQYLSVFIIKAVYFGHHIAYPDINRLITSMTWRLYHEGKSWG